MTDAQRDRLRSERDAYRASRGSRRQNDQGSQRVQIAEMRAERAEMRAELESLRAERSKATPPTEVVPDAAATAISQISTGTAGGSIMGGRNQRRDQRQSADTTGRG